MEWPEKTVKQNKDQMGRVRMCLENAANENNYTFVHGIQNWKQKMEILIHANVGDGSKLQDTQWAYKCQVSQKIAV